MTTAATEESGTAIQIAETGEKPRAIFQRKPGRRRIADRSLGSRLAARDHGVRQSVRPSIGASSGPTLGRFAPAPIMEIADFFTMR